MGEVTAEGASRLDRRAIAATSLAIIFDPVSSGALVTSLILSPQAQISFVGNPLR